MQIPKTMTAAVLTGHGGLDKLEIRHDVPVPQPIHGELLIKVAACGMNNTDINTRIGWYSDEVAGETNAGATDGFDQVDDNSVGGWGNSGIVFPRIQGADIVGHVVAVGAGVSADWLDARVMSDNWLRDWSDPMNRTKTGYIGSECDGGYAQYVALPHQNVGRVESAWTDAELATLSCSYTTAENMLERTRVTADDTVLVTGASGGVGSALIQLVKRRGARVIALTSASKAEQVMAIGADAVIRRGVDADWLPIIRAQTGTDKVSVVADVVGGKVFANLLAVLARGGRYVTSGAIAGKHVTVDLSHLYLNDWDLLGSTVIGLDVFPNLISYVEKGEIRPLLHATYRLAEIGQAQTAFLAKQHIGNIVLVPPH